MRFFEKFKLRRQYCWLQTNIQVSNLSSYKVFYLPSKQSISSLLPVGTSIQSSFYFSPFHTKTLLSTCLLYKVFYLSICLLQSTRNIFSSLSCEQQKVPRYKESYSSGLTFELRRAKRKSKRSSICEASVGFNSYSFTIRCVLFFLRLNPSDL